MSDRTGLISKSLHPIPILAFNRESLAVWLKRQPQPVRNWVAAHGFEAKPGSLLALASAKGGVRHILFGASDLGSPWDWASLPKLLPKGDYRIEGRLKSDEANALALGWALGGYAFAAYKTKEKTPPPAARLVWPEKADRKRVAAVFEATALARDLISTPSADLGPSDLARHARALAKRHKAAFSQVSGARLADGFPAIFAVGKGSARPPLLIDFSWGNPRHPKVTLVGKGVCFDSGGLDLKPSSAMKLMKKDMGGAAQALALASLIMTLRLPIRLRVLIPAVENMPGPNAMRPLDVLKTRAGVSVEVGNTDAEGRLILADALCEAGRGKPELIFDFATLTGAARSALGPDLPALFANDDKLAQELAAAGDKTGDPMWRLPLWAGYEDMLKSKLADVNSAPDSPFAGAITAALFLQRFVPSGVSWAHFDLFAWNSSDRPGRPQGGEAMTVRAVFAYLEKRFGK